MLLWYFLLDYWIIVLYSIICWFILEHYLMLQHCYNLPLLLLLQTPRPYATISVIIVRSCPWVWRVATWTRKRTTRTACRRKRTRATTTALRWWASQWLEAQVRFHPYCSLGFSIYPILFFGFYYISHIIQWVYFFTYHNHLMCLLYI